MKQVVLVLIRLYWALPNGIKNKCLFKESCSNHVFRITKADGYLAGIKALKSRIKTCNPNYRILDQEEGRLLICQNGETIQTTEIADWLIE